MMLVLVFYHFFWRKQVKHKIFRFCLAYSKSMLCNKMFASRTYWSYVRQPKETRAEHYENTKKKRPQKKKEKERKKIYNRNKIIETSRSFEAFSSSRCCVRRSQLCNKRRNVISFLGRGTLDTLDTPFFGSTDIAQSQSLQSKVRSTHNPVHFRT